MGAAAGSGGVLRVLRNSAVLGVAKVLERGTGFVVALLVASELGVEGLGIYATAWAIYGLAWVAGEAGTTSYLVREISRDPERTASYTVHLSVVALVVGAALTAIGQLLVPYLGYTAEVEASVYVALFAVIPGILNGIQEAVFVAHGRVEFETLTRLCASVGYVILVWWLLAQGEGVPVLLQAFVATQCVVGVVYFLLISRFIVRLRPQFRWSLAVRLIREIKSFAASSALAAVFARPELVILSLLATEREVGVYSAALRLAELPLLLPEVLMMNVFPLLSRAFGTTEDVFTAWQTAAVRAVLAFSLPLAACLIVGADQIIQLFWGGDFRASAPVLRVLACNLVFLSLGAVLWRSLVARGGQNTNVAIQSVTVVFRLTAGGLLIVLSGAMGAAVACAVTGWLHFMLLARATARSGARVGIVRAGWRFAIAAGFGGLVVWLLERWLSLPLPLELGVGAVVYLASSLAFGAVTADDRLMLSRPGARADANSP